MGPTPRPCRGDLDHDDNPPRPKNRFENAFPQNPPVWPVARRLAELLESRLYSESRHVLDSQRQRYRGHDKMYSEWKSYTIVLGVGPSKWLAILLTQTTALNNVGLVVVLSSSQSCNLLNCEVFNDNCACDCASRVTIELALLLSCQWNFKICKIFKLTHQLSRKFFTAPKLNILQSILILSHTSCIELIFQPNLQPHIQTRLQIPPTRCLLSGLRICLVRATSRSWVDVPRLFESQRGTKMQQLSLKTQLLLS